MKETGGSAFPEVNSSVTSGITEVYSCGGMSLRDYFAGLALAGLFSNPRRDAEGDGSIPKAFAEAAYECADAMLMERKKE